MMKNKSRSYHIYRPFRLCGILASAPLLLACASGPKLEAGATTYPRYQVTKVRKVVNIPSPITLGIGVNFSGQDSGGAINEGIAFSPGQGIFQFNFDEEEIGDTAAHEIYILPRSRRESSEKKLLSRVKEGGKKRCGGDHRVSRTKYFFGREATLRFLGIKSPALRVIYRCPINVGPLENNDFRTVQSLAKRLPETKYFDISARDYPSNLDKTVLAVDKIIGDLGMEVKKRGNRNGGKFIIAERETGASKRGKPRKLVVFMNERSGVTSVTLKYFTYWTSEHERGVRGAGTYKPGFVWGPVPADRDFAYTEATRLFGKIASQLEG